MSAMLVSERLIHSLVNAAIDHRKGKVRFFEFTEAELQRMVRADQPNEADFLGRVLWVTNLDAVEARYSEKDQAQRDLLWGYTFDKSKARPLSAVELIKALDYYTYQTDTVVNWRDLRACAFVERMNDYAIQNLPGYEEAPWGF